MQTKQYFAPVFLFAILAAITIPGFLFAASCVDDNDCDAGEVCKNSICSKQAQITVSITIPGEDTGGSGLGPPTATFIGKAYPFALVTILRNEAVAAVLEAEADGTFSKKFNALPFGVTTFGIWAEDTEGRVSRTLSYTLVLSAGTQTTISNIFLPPTIELRPGSQIHRGEDIKILGHIFPLSKVSIFVNSLFEQIVVGKTNGEWSYNLDTSGLDLGTYEVKAKAVSPNGAQSVFSAVEEFTVVAPGVPIFPSPTIPPEEIEACPFGDLNGDGLVDMADLSVLLFWWERWDRCPDQNSDGIVDMIDVSIVLFWWTEN